jgi:hypothetical protein
MPMIWLYVFLLDFLIPFLCDPDLQCITVGGRGAVTLKVTHRMGAGFLKPFAPHPLKEAYRSISLEGTFNRRPTSSFNEPIHNQIVIIIGGSSKTNVHRNVFTLWKVYFLSTFHNHFFLSLPTYLH